MYDFHIHSDFSLDSKTPMEKIVKTAMDKNLKSICITDHVDFDATEDGIDLLFRPMDYFRDINRVKYKYKDKIDILAGVEIGMQHHLSERYNQFIDNYRFDFVIMSIHAINNKDIFLDYQKLDLSPGELITNYYNEMYDCIEVFDNYDVLGHIDFIDRYVNNTDVIRKYDTYMAQIESILRLLISKGKGIEVNTGGLRYSLGYFHPKPQILEMYKDLGGEIITIGSDAHVAEHVGYEYKFAEKVLRDTGFKYIYIFRDRKKYPIQIL